MPNPDPRMLGLHTQPDTAPDPARERRRTAALQDVLAALENLTEVVDMADGLPVEGSRASGAIAAASSAAMSASVIVKDEINQRGWGVS